MKLKENILKRKEKDLESEKKKLKDKDINSKNKLIKPYKHTLDELYKLNKFKKLKTKLQSKSKTSKLTKKELCILITEHYLYRIKLIKIIKSIIHKNNNDYKGFCHAKYDSIMNTEFVYLI